MSSEVTLSVVDNDLKDVIQNFFEIQSAVHGYLGPETQHELVRKLSVTRSYLHTVLHGLFCYRLLIFVHMFRKSLTISLKTLSDHTTLDPAHADAASKQPNSNPALPQADPPLHTIKLPPEIVDYVDAARNPDIYTREFVELVQKGNQDLKGKAEAFSSFRDTLAREMASAMPECKKEVIRVVKATGGDAQQL
ncbi:hypothetical protein TRV_03359 [Trichophyton verrucosum HKI 0517]|uniref:Mediator of RNA polymerase II transcription subunit 10 n=1 Tax=Trichophyton verrucosum (strain HKI 0517) TaxID=663202 RepID=D4D8C3_TRIVH|nr:uncharacterized protein TRV_03359 [Trichophyton verrucosum HKI 0517]EFE41899.1 hypothetical protein TRV_03359 [Trichophyton verrucosum HKI 0517]